jgi:hypothetical protein
MDVGCVAEWRTARYCGNGRRQATLGLFTGIVFLFFKPPSARRSFHSPNLLIESNIVHDLADSLLNNSVHFVYGNI